MAHSKTILEEYQQLIGKEQEALALRGHLLGALSSEKPAGAGLPDYFIQTFSHHFNLHELVNKVTIAGGIIDGAQSKKIAKAVAATPYNGAAVRESLTVLARIATAGLKMSNDIAAFAKTFPDVPAEGMTPAEILLHSLKLPSSDIAQELGFKTLFFDLAQGGKNDIARALTDRNHYYNSLAMPNGKAFGNALPLPLFKEDILAMVENPTSASARLLSETLREHVRTNTVAKSRLNKISANPDYWTGLQMRVPHAPKTAPDAAAERIHPHSNPLAQALDYLRYQARERGTDAPFAIDRIADALGEQPHIVQDTAKIRDIFIRHKVAASLKQSPDALVALANMFLPETGTAAITLPGGTTHQMGQIKGLRELEAFGRKLGAARANDGIG